MVRFGWFFSYNNIENVHFLRRVRQRKTDCVIITSFRQSILSQTTLSTNEKSLCYLNYWLWYQSADKGGNGINLVNFYFCSFINFLFEHLVWVILFARRLSAVNPSMHLAFLFLTGWTRGFWYTWWGWSTGKYWRLLGTDTKSILSFFWPPFNYLNPLRDRKYCRWSNSKKFTI